MDFDFVAFPLFIITVNSMLICPLSVVLYQTVSMRLGIVGQSQNHQPHFTILTPSIYLAPECPVTPKWLRLRL